MWRIQRQMYIDLTNVDIRVDLAQACHFRNAAYRYIIYLYINHKSDNYRIILL